MPIVAMLIAALPVPLPERAAPVCAAARLRLSIDGRNGDFDGMSHSGTELVVGNIGRDCMMPALPLVQFRGARGDLLSAVRRPPPRMHPGPVMMPVRLRHGQHATADLRWVSGPVFPRSRALRASSVGVRIGTVTVRAPIVATLFGQAGERLTFDQSPFRPADDGTR